MVLVFKKRAMLVVAKALRAVTAGRTEAFKATRGIIEVAIRRAANIFGYEVNRLVHPGFVMNTLML